MHEKNSQEDQKLTNANNYNVFTSENVEQVRNTPMFNNYSNSEKN